MKFDNKIFHTLDCIYILTLVYIMYTRKENKTSHRVKKKKRKCGPKCNFNFDKKKSSIVIE
jgi:hypothetical protein